MVESQRTLEKGREQRRKARSIISNEFAERVGKKLEGIIRQRDRRWFAPSVSPNRGIASIGNRVEIAVKSLAKEVIEPPKSAGSSSVRRKTWNKVNN
jgi:hypothetical protein